MKEHNIHTRKHSATVGSKRPAQIFVCGSLAYDYIMGFPGSFAEHLLPDKLHTISLSFLVNSMKRMRGGTAGNIAYTLALLGATPTIASAAGSDFSAYKTALKDLGVRTEGIRIVASEFTASCFITTDSADNQIVSFYPGAASHARNVDLRQLGVRKSDWVVVSPTDPVAMEVHTRACRDLGVRYVFDPGKQTPRMSGEQIRLGLAGCSVLIANEYELGLVAKAIKVSERKLLAMAPVTVVTLGSRGARIHSQEEDVIIPAVTPNAVVDPTGAGDAYLGGFVLGLSRGLALRACSRLGSLAATYCIEARGCQHHTYSQKQFTTRYASAFSEPLALELTRPKAAGRRAAPKANRSR